MHMVQDRQAGLFGLLHRPGQEVDIHLEIRAEVKHQLAQLIDLKNEHGATLVLVTHNPEIARVADRVIALKDGHLTG